MTDTARVPFRPTADEQLRALTAELNRHHAALQAANAELEQTRTALANSRQQRASLLNDLTDAGNEVDQLTADLARARNVIAAQEQQLAHDSVLLARLRNLIEQADRAWADHDPAADYRALATSEQIDQARANYATSQEG